MYDDPPIEVRVRINGEERWIPASELLSHFDYMRMVAQRKEE